MSIETHFALAERAEDEQFKQQFEIISSHPVINGLMNVVSGLLAVLNEYRQILAINETLLEMLGIDDADKVFGLRPGEALNCVHASKSQGGCGTTEFCSTCGAAIAIVTSIGEDKPVQRKCAVTTEKKGKKVELYFNVHAHPIRCGGKRFILLFLQDISRQQELAALERVFFHDINNILTGLVSLSQLMILKNESLPELAKKVHHLSLRLSQEVAIQRILSSGGISSYQPLLRKLSVSQIIKEIEEIFTKHPAAENKKLDISQEIPEFFFIGDLSLIMRVLNNMLLNAFEATEKGGEIKFWIERERKIIAFYVWNKKPIPFDISKRIFQRNFSTKQGMGRGLGTYSMKLFGDQFLGGKVDFSTSKTGGTTFCLKLPFNYYE
jgi:hypothetical protein